MLAPILTIKLVFLISALLARLMVNKIGL